MGRPAKQIVDGKQQCCICKEWKPLDDFYPSKVTKSGFETRCNSCTKARTRNFFNENTRQYLAVLCRGHRGIANRPSARSRRRVLAAESQVTPEILWDLWQKQEGRCAITGVPMTHLLGHGMRMLTNVTIDRIDSDKGYTEDNIRLACKAANWMKNQMTDRELLQWAALILNGPLAK